MKGNEFRKLRKDCGLTQSGLGLLLKRAERTISLWESMEDDIIPEFACSFITNYHAKNNLLDKALQSSKNQR
jgi:transcriptional regulator with XRE-family HTH domain